MLKQFLQFSTIILLSLSLGGCNWCCSNPILPEYEPITIPQYPIDQIDKPKNFNVEYEIIDTNGRVEIIMQKDHFINFTKYTKNIKENQILLIDAIKDWNIKLQTIEKEFNTIDK